MRTRALVLCLALGLTACQFVHENRDADQRPEVAVGTGATVLMPGQAPPVLGAPSASGAGTSGAPAGPDVAMIGGSSGETSVSTREREVPLVGPITTLFGYPFWIFGKKLSQKADQEAARRAANGGQSSAPLPQAGHDERERERLASENRKLLEELHGQPPAPPPAPATAPAPSPPARSIGDELAALQARLGSGAPPTGAPEALPSGARVPAETRDQNGDGRPDLWVYAERGKRVEEAFDDDGDGRVDRQRFYGSGGELQRVEEDLDGDGALEAVTLYRDGVPFRKRVDSNADGLPDTWSFYSGGEVVRNERDRDGDGFRDLILFYEAGHLVREEEDRNGDGRSDLVVLYRDGEVSQRDEDLDHDGQPDVQSFYEGGKLVRRQLHSPELLGTGSQGAGS